MKLPSHPVRSGERGTRNKFAFASASLGAPRSAFRTAAGGFTLIEIALCMAIIGFALVSILLVLPGGMNTQRETREQTIINEDASVLLEAIRGGARGLDDLTNYVYAITNYQQVYDAFGKPAGGPYTSGYTYSAASVPGNADAQSMYLTNGLRIVGLLSTPEFTSANPPNVDFAPLASTFGVPYTSNHVVAYVRSVNGLAAEKPPQDNPIMRGDAFTYRVLCVNAPVPIATNLLPVLPGAQPGYALELAGNLRELRLTFMWPQLPNGNVGGYRQTYRATVAGQLVQTNYQNYFAGIYPLYFYESGSFTNHTEIP